MNIMERTLTGAECAATIKMVTNSNLSCRMI